MQSKISHLTLSPLFNLWKHLSHCFSLFIPAIFLQKSFILSIKDKFWDDFGPKSTFIRSSPSSLSTVRILHRPPSPPLLHLPFTLSYLPPFHCFPSLLPNHSLLVYGSDSGSFLMSSEMWSRDHSQTGRHRPSPNSHHSSIIHALIFISGMKTFILKWDSFFMSWSGVWLHLFWQKTSVFPTGCRNLQCMEVQGFEVEPVHVAHIVTSNQRTWNT